MAIKYLNKKLEPPHSIFLLERGNIFSWTSELNLLVVLGPAGYGKSAFVEQSLYRASEAFSWLSIDEHDNIPRSFWRYCSIALASLLPDIETKSGNLLSHTSEPNYIDYVDWLITEIETVSRSRNRPSRFTLVLDNYQFITHTDIVHSLNRFLDYIPHWLKVVVITRQSPDLNLIDKLSKRKARLITQFQLAFTANETKAFIEFTLAEQASPKIINQIHAKTEGWPALVAILCYSIQSGLDLEKALSPAQKNISEFLLQQIFEHLNTQDRAIFQTLAVPGKFDFRLANQLFGPDGDRAIKQFVHHEYLAQSIPNDPGWYRFNTIIRAWLQDQRSLDSLELPTPVGLEPDREEKMSTIINYFLAESEFDEALSLTIKLKQWQRAVDILQLQYPNHLQILQSGSIEKILSLFPPGIVAQYPYLLMAQALHQFSLFKYHDAITSIQMMEASLANAQGDLPDNPGLKATRPYLQTGAKFVRSHMLRFSGNVTAATEMTRELLDALDADQYPLRCWCHCGLAADHFIRDEILASVNSGFNSVALAKHVGDGTCVMAALGWLIPALLLSGQVKLAEQTAEENLIWLKDRGFECLPDMVLVQSQLVTLHREKFDLQRAYTIYHDLVNQLDVKTDPRNIIHAQYVVYFDLLLSSNQLDEAGKVITELEVVVRNNFSSEDFVGFFDIEAMKAIVNLKQGKTQSLMLWYSKYRKTHPFCSDSGPSSEPKDGYITHKDNNLALLACIAELVMNQDCSEQLQQIKQVSLDNGVIWRAVKADIILTLLLQTQGKKGSAQNVLEDALATAREAGYVGVFAEDIQRLRPLIKVAQQNPPISDYCEFLLSINHNSRFDDTRVLDTPPKAADQNTEASRSMIEKLTPREAEVLERLSDGLSNKLIAEKMGVSLSTVKNHLRNLFGKLQVNSRTEALAVARALELI